MIQSEEPRTFEQRFGERCPFCNRTWGNPEPCDPQPATSNFNRRNYKRPVYPDRTCASCRRPFTPRAVNSTVCSSECAHERQRERDRRRPPRVRRGAVTVVA